MKPHICMISEMRKSFCIKSRININNNLGNTNSSHARGNVANIPLLLMSSFNSFSENAAEFYDFTNLHELRNACYNLSAQKILDYANNADADEVISLLIVLEGKKRLEFIHGLNLSQLAAMAEDLHTIELNELMNELPQEKRDRLMYRLSDHVLYQLSRLKD